MQSGCSVGLVFYISSSLESIFFFLLLFYVLCSVRISSVTGVDFFISTSFVAYVFESEVEMEICLKHIGWVDTMRAAFAEAQRGGGWSLLLLSAPRRRAPGSTDSACMLKKGEKRGKLGGREEEEGGGWERNKRWKSKGGRL